MAVDEPLGDLKGFVCLLQLLGIGEHYVFAETHGCLKEQLEEM